jgi:hypothetical protein
MEAATARALALEIFASLNFASLNQLPKFVHKAKESQGLEKRGDFQHCSTRRDGGAIQSVGAREPSQTPNVV